MANPFVELARLMKAGAEKYGGKVASEAEKVGAKGGVVAAKVKPLDVAEGMARSGETGVAQVEPRMRPPEPTPIDVGTPPPRERPAPPSDTSPIQADTTPPVLATTDEELAAVVRSTEQKRLGEKETNINFNRIESTEDVLTLADEVSRQSKDRGLGPKRTTLEEIGRKAKEVPIESLREIIGDRAFARAEKILQPQQLVALRDIWVTLADDVHRTAAEISRNKNVVTDEALALFRDNVTKFRAVQEVVEGQTRFAGQLLGSFRIKAKPGTALREAEVQALLGDIGGREVALALADDLARTRGVKHLSNAVKENWLLRSLRYFEAYRYNNMLSGVATHGRNIAGNMGAIGSRVLVKPVSAAVGATRAGIRQLRGVEAADPLLHAQDQQVYFREVTAEMGGLVYGMMDGVRLAYKSFMDADFKVGARTVPEPEVRPSIARWTPKTTIGKGIGWFLDLALLHGASRLLQASDMFFKGVIYRMDASARAVRQASAEGLEGAAFVARVEELSAKPPSDLFMRSLDEVEEATFTTRLTGSMAAISAGRTKLGLVGSAIIPFMRVIVNITKWTVRHTALSFVNPQFYRDLNTGGAVADKAIGQLVAGGMLGVWAYDQVGDGRLTGSGLYVSKETRQAWMASGWRPNSWYNEETGEYTDLRFAAPVTAVVQFYASLAEMKHFSDDEFGIDDYLIGTMGAFTNVIIDQNFARSMNEWLNAATDPERYGERVVTSYVTSATVPNWLRDLRRAQEVDAEFQDPDDPNYQTNRRELKTGNLWSNLGAALQDRVPGVWDDLPPAVDYFGYPPTPGYKWFDMAPSRHTPDRELYAELIENGVTIKRPPPTLRLAGVDIDLHTLGAAEGKKPGWAYYVWQKRYGTARREAVKEMVSSYDYKTAPVGAAGESPDDRPTRGDLLQKAMSAAKGMALEQFATEDYPELESAWQQERDMLRSYARPLPPHLAPGRPGPTKKPASQPSFTFGSRP